jgi:hypothetical protein
MSRKIHRDVVSRRKKKKKKKNKRKEKKTDGWRLTIARTIGTQEACISPTAASTMAQRDGGDGG